MHENVKMAFEFARDFHQLLISLSTGLIAVSVTFNKEVLRFAKGISRVLVISWLAQVLSIAFGLWAIMALTGSVAADPGESWKGFGGNVLLPANLQVVTFILGSAVFVAYGVMALRREARAPANPPPPAASAASPHPPDPV